MPLVRGLAESASGKRRGNLASVLTQILAGATIIEPRKATSLEAILYKVEWNSPIFLRISEKLLSIIVANSPTIPVAWHGIHLLYARTSDNIPSRHL